MPITHNVDIKLSFEMFDMTPGQKGRMRSAIAERDIDYFRHCVQM